MRESNKKLLVWKVRLGDNESRIALEKDSLEVWVNGEKIETEAGFTDEGSEMTFELNEKQARIVAVTSGKRREGILHQVGFQPIRGHLWPANQRASFGKPI